MVARHSCPLFVVQVFFALLICCKLRAAQGAGPSTAFDCAARALALEFAALVQPTRSAPELQLVADALAGSPQYAPNSPGWCNLTVQGPLRQPPSLPPPPPATYFVDPITGSDSGPGSEAAPFRSLQRALRATRAVPPPGTIVLRSGVHFLALGEGGLGTTGGLVLGAADSGLTIQAHPEDASPAWVSGGVPLPVGLVWTPVDTSDGRNVWTTRSLRGSNVTDVPGLRSNGSRLIRARYPNADPELGFGPTFSPAAWLPPAWAGPADTFNPPEPRRNDSVEGSYYELGVGGGCDAYVGGSGFFCGNATQRFSSNLSMPRWPAGMVAPPTVLPHSPYASGARLAVLLCWNSPGWYTRMHEVGAYDPVFGTFAFEGGGFQGHEGDDGGGGAVLENVLEELDAPGEWFFNASTQDLTLWWNASAGTPPPSDGVTLVRTHGQVLLNLSGSAAAPVAHVSLLGLGFRDTALSYLQPHGLPSSGDWAIARTGALFAEGTVGFTVANCTFERLDGHAVFLSGFHRNASIADSDFRWLGESAVALWGRTTGGPHGGPGPDTRGGDQPRGTTIARNMMRELGVWQKQSSGVFLAEQAGTAIDGNFIFNGPRAGVNFNDHAMGGDVVSRNLIFNECRESGDHGPINSWSRTAYWNDLRGGDPSSATPLPISVLQNVIIANYGSQTPVDNDDSSAHWLTARNFLLYGGSYAHKSDFGGHDNVWTGNVVAFVPHVYDNSWGLQLPGHPNGHVDNIDALNGDGPWAYQLACNLSGPLAWEYQQGYLPEGGDVLPGAWMVLDAARDLCAATINCTAVTYQPGEPSPPGPVYVYFKSMGDAPFNNTCCGTWTLNRTGAPTVVGGNTYYSATGAVEECGMALAAWQALDPADNDPGSVAAPWPEDAVLIAAARDALGMAPPSRPGSNVSLPLLSSFPGDILREVKASLALRYPLLGVERK